VPEIILSTLNARFIHSAFGLRYLKANMEELRHKTVIREFTRETWAIDIAEKLLAEHPRIIGFGVYIWNVEQTTRLVALLKTVAPEVTIVLGGPEVSYEPEEQPVVALADYVLAGPADLAFAALCRQILNGNPPADKLLQAPPLELERIKLPYQEYTDEDIAHRIVYVEASRGCPFKCEFCLSALDKSSRPFPLSAFLGEMEQLYQRGVRHFKFVDRTFNLNVKASSAILEFFLKRLAPGLFLHFEVIPDRLPDGLKALLQRFPEGVLQLEVGVQSFNPEVQSLISRKQNNEKSCENLRWLREQTHAHLHTDLIIGLPEEGLESFAESFNRLYRLNPHEIQVGALKRLRGAPIARHSETAGLRFNPVAPYEVLSTARIDFATMQRLNRFARYWDMIGNSGRFKTTLPALLGDQPFERFLNFSDWLFETTGQVHRFALKRLFELLFEGMSAVLEIDAESARRLLAEDFSRARQKGLPSFLRAQDNTPATIQKREPTKHRSRQSRHQ